MCVCVITDILIIALDTSIHYSIPEMMLILLKQREHILNEPPNCVQKQEWNLDVKIPMIGLTFSHKKHQADSDEGADVSQQCH